MTLALGLTHLQAMALFALVVSLAFALLSKQTRRERIIYTAWSLFWFLAVAVAIGWLMYPLTR